MRHRSTRFVALLVALGASVPVQVARADARTEARRHFRRGMELVVERRIDEGVAELEEAYNILPHPNVLYNIGRAYAEVGRYEESREYFDRYLESDPPDREEVRAIVAAIESRIATRAEEAQAGATGASASGTQASAAGTSSSTPSGEGATASEADVAELRATAAQLRGIAALSGATGLVTRADELERMADAFERARAARAAAAQAGTSGASEGGAVTEGGTVAEGTGSAEATEVGDAGADGQAAAEALDVQASTEGGTYEETVVSSSRFAQSPLDAASATTIVTAQDIRLTGITSFPELLRRVAGVHLMSMTPADTNVAIRGFNRTITPRVLVLVNGRSTYLDALGTTFWPSMAIDVEDVERIEIIRGPASALYGANAFSGIVNILTRAPGDDAGTSVSVGAGNGNAMRGRVATSGRVDDLSYRFSAGYSQVDRFTRFFDDAAREDLEQAVATDRAYQGAHARMDLRYRITDDVRLNLEAGYSHAGTFNLWANAGFTDTQVSGPTAYAMTSLQTGWGSIRAFYNRNQYSIAQTDEHLPVMDIGSNVVDVEGMFAREFVLGVPHNLHAGVGFRWKSIEWDILDDDQVERHYSGFFEDTLRVSDLVRITAGFRVDKHPLIENPIWSPRAALVLRPTEGQSIRLSGTSSFRTMSFAESYVQFSLPTPAATAVGGIGLGSSSGRGFPVGAPVLRPERIITAEVGYLNQENENFDVEVSAYYNRVFDIMGIGSAGGLFTLADYANPALAEVTAFDTQNNRFHGGTSLLANPPDKYNVYGGELAVRAYPVAGLDLYANYSLNLNFIVDSELGNDRDVRQPRHIVNAGFQYRAPFGLDVAMDFHWYDRTLWPEVLFTAAGLDLENIPLEGYYMMNGRIGMRLLDDRLDVGFAAYNFTNNQVKQHPYAQTMSARYMATVTARF